MGYYRLGYALPAQTFTTLFSFDGTNGQALLVTTGPGGAACITGRDVRHRLPRYPGNRKSVGGRRPVEAIINGSRRQHEETANQSAPPQG
jgi:hypothetical protein